MFVYLAAIKTNVLFTAVGSYNKIYWSLCLHEIKSVPISPEIKYLILFQLFNNDEPFFAICANNARDWIARLVFASYCNFDVRHGGLLRISDTSGKRNLCFRKTHFHGL